MDYDQGLEWQSWPKHFLTQFAQTQQHLNGTQPQSQPLTAQMQMKLKENKTGTLHVMKNTHLYGFFLFE